MTLIQWLNAIQIVTFGGLLVFAAAVMLGSWILLRREQRQTRADEQDKFSRFMEFLALVRANVEPARTRRKS